MCVIVYCVGVLVCVLVWCDVCCLLNLVIWYLVCVLYGGDEVCEYVWWCVVDDVC